FVMPAEIEGGILFFINLEATVSLAGIVVLRQVACIRIKASDLQVNAVLRGDLLLQLQRPGEPLKILVCPLAILRFVKSIHGVAQPTNGAEERAGLNPIATAAIFREGADADWLRIEEA